MRSEPDPPLHLAHPGLKFQPVKRPLRVKCPTCKKEGDWFAGRYGPFCSERCKLVDLGKWLNEEIKISEPLRPDRGTDAN